MMMMMRDRVCLGMLVACLVAVALVTGCVERQLTVQTVPAGADVMLNDEHIGVSPATVAFNWYGDYSVRISKHGYETLDTHRELQGPWYDAFPFDFFVQVLCPERIVDEYQWTFELQPKEQVTAEQLLQSATRLRSDLE
jgi:hypothetical protein